VLLAEHHEAIEYDLLIRGIDLLDLYRGTLSIRRLGMLIDRLLADTTSELAREITPSLRRYTPENVTAEVWDLLAFVHLKNAPTYPRPGEAEKKAEFERQRHAALEAQLARRKAVTS
jgi:hypothetical protein